MFSVGVGTKPGAPHVAQRAWKHDAIAHFAAELPFPGSARACGSVSARQRYAAPPPRWQGSVVGARITASAATICYAPLPLSLSVATTGRQRASCASHASENDFENETHDTKIGPGVLPVRLTRHHPVRRAIAEALIGHASRKGTESHACTYGGGDFFPLIDRWVNAGLGFIGSRRAAPQCRPGGKRAFTETEPREIKAARALRHHSRRNRELRNRRSRTARWVPSLIWIRVQTTLAGDTR